MRIMICVPKYLARKHLLRTLRDYHFTWLSEPYEGLAVCMQGKGSTFIYQLF